MAPTKAFEELMAVPVVGDRKVALLLHTLCVSDRRWLMAQLSPEQIARISPLLKELQDLDWPVDEALLHEAMAPAASPTTEQGATDSGARPWLIAGEHEPAHVRRMLVRAAPLPVQSFLRESWGVPSASDEGRPFVDADLPERLATAIRAHVAKCSSTDPAEVLHV